MARNQSYDHVNNLITREMRFDGPAAASGTVGLWSPQQKMRLVAVHGVVQVAGTNVAGNTYTVRGGVNGTTSIGALAMGTNTAGAVVHQAIGSVVDRGEALNLLKGADATGVSGLSYEWEVLPDALQS